MKDGFGSFRWSVEFCSDMKIKTISAIGLACILAACGPGKTGKSASEAKNTPTAALPTSPEYDSIGIVAALNGQTITLDHEGASAAQLAAGRTQFQAYGDILAEAPLAPGSRVAFKFHKVGAAWELTELKAR